MSYLHTLEPCIIHRDLKPGNILLKTAPEKASRTLPDPASDPELDLLLDRAWTRLGRRPWADAQRRRLLSDTASGATGRRSGGQGEIAIWGGKRLRIERQLT